MEEMIKQFLNIRGILSILALFVGLIFYIGWGVTYGVWADIGQYSVTILFVLGGILGLLLTYFDNK